MQLLRSASFGNIQCNVYRDNDQLFMTREQIGTALEYGNPADSIRKIHDRNKPRLDNFSVTVKLSGTDGKMYDTYLYSAKGIYEICRHSNQPKADIFYDWVYELLEGLRKGELTVSPQWKLPQSYIEALEAHLQSEREKQLLQAENQVLKPKAELHDKFLSADNTQSIGQVAKALGTGEIRLFRFLREQGILMSNNSPYQVHIDSGRFKVIEKSIQMGAKVQNKTQTLVTPKGVNFIAKLLSDSKSIQAM
jgi:anti-repressor protein